jgi:hypothetical protein
MEFMGMLWLSMAETVRRGAARRHSLTLSFSLFLLSFPLLFLTLSNSLRNSCSSGGIATSGSTDCRAAER